VLSVDEETGMPAQPDSAHQEHEYVRHVTAVLLDNGSSHIARDTSWWFMDHPRFHPHSTFSHASWLNQVELFFSILARRLLKRGEFGSVEDGGQGDGVHRRLQPHRHAVSLDLRRPTPQGQLICQQLTRSCTSAQKRERSSYK
jgi:DDE superfamily endonuclease